MSVLVRLRGAETMDVDLQTSGMVVVMLFGNGLPGDVRLEGESIEAIEALRTLILRVGNCEPVSAPPAHPLGQKGDECYRQLPSALVFLNPVPFSP